MKLYNKAKTGKIVQWEIELDDNRYRTISGQKDGSLITSDWTTCEGKNIGKANETTPNQQALREVEAKIKKKKEEGYVEDVALLEDRDGSRQEIAMLAEKYKDFSKNIPDDEVLYVQPKLDGCLYYNTLIDTDLGKLKIGDIVENDINCKVITYNEIIKKLEFKPILTKAKEGVDIKETKEIEWFNIELTNGTTLKITGNQLVYLPKLKCWRRVDELQESDYLLVKNN